MWRPRRAAPTGLTVSQDDYHSARGLWTGVFHGREQRRRRNLLRLHGYHAVFLFIALALGIHAVVALHARHCAGVASAAVA
jgi:hypothetical protein